MHTHFFNPVLLFSLVLTSFSFSTRSENGVRREDRETGKMEKRERERGGNAHISLHRLHNLNAWNTL